MNDKNIINVENIFLNIGRKLCSIIGWREAIGHIYALLYLEDRPMSLDDIAKRANLSKSNVWGIIQQLLRLGAVNKVWLVNNRKDYYMAERDFDLVLARGIIPLLQSKVTLLNSYLDNAKTSFRDMKNKGVVLDKKYEKMFDDIVKQKEKIESFLNILSGFDLSS